MPSAFSTKLSTVLVIAARGFCLLLLFTPLHGADRHEAADGGDPWAQLNLGAAYDHGLAGLASDPERAVHWYRRAAEAQFNLAHCLATG